MESSNVWSLTSFIHVQRNVGILEKIAQPLLAPGPGSNQATRQELEQQYVMSYYTIVNYGLGESVYVKCLSPWNYKLYRYQVQLDVLRQLEARVRDQLQTQKKQKQNINNHNEANKQQTLIKLERDFDRVQVIATNCKAKVARQQKQLQQRGQANAANALDNNGSSTVTNSAAESLQQEQQRFQLQLQQDRLHQEIMTEREQEIRNINKGMHQVNEIYKDLAHIVGSQQEHVDQIETQMDNAKGNAESGLSQVQKANEKYNQSQCTIS